MGKKNLNNEEKMIDLLEKNLIVQLYINGASRDEIKKTLAIGSEKVNPVIKHIVQNVKKKNG